MRYTLFLHYPEMTPGDVGEAAIEAGRAAFQAYGRALEDAGILVIAEMHQPVAHAATLALRDGHRRVEHGPWAGTTQQIGGTFVIEVPDLDAALTWAELCPAAAWGTIEVRPSAVRFANGKWMSVT